MSTSCTSPTILVCIAPRGVLRCGASGAKTGTPQSHQHKLVSLVGSSVRDQKGISINISYKTSNLTVKWRLFCLPPGVVIGPAHYPCPWSWIEGCWFGTGGPAPSLMDSLSFALQRPVTSKGAWRFLLDASVPALSDVRMLELLGCFHGPCGPHSRCPLEVCPLDREASLWSGTPLLQGTKLFAAASEPRSMLPLGHLHKLSFLLCSRLPPLIFWLTLVILHTLASIPLSPGSLPWSSQPGMGASPKCFQSSFYILPLNYVLWEL